MSLISKQQQQTLQQNGNAWGNVLAEEKKKWNAGGVFMCAKLTNDSGVL